MDSSQIEKVADKYADGGFHGVADMVSLWDDFDNTFDPFDDVTKLVKFSSITEIKAYSSEGIIKKIMTALVYV